MWADGILFPHLHKAVNRWQQLTQPFPLEQEFEIKEVFDIGSYTYDTAKQMQRGSPFKITPSSRLGDISLEPYLKQPMSVDEKGRNRVDIFIFCCSVLSPKPIKESVFLLTDT